MPIYVLSSAKTTVAELWEEYTTGVNGGSSVRELTSQYKTKWRTYPGGKQAWAWHKIIYDAIELRMHDGETEAAAIAALQERLSAHTKPPPQQGKRGRKPALANWKGLVAELRPRAERGEEEQEEQVEQVEQVEQGASTGASGLERWGVCDNLLYAHVF